MANTTDTTMYRRDELVAGVAVPVVAGTWRWQWTWSTAGATRTW